MRSGRVSFRGLRDGYPGVEGSQGFVRLDGPLA